MDTIIKINNAKFYSHHGVLDYERNFGNQFEVDVEMKCDLSELGESDELEKTVNYLTVYRLVDKVFHEKKYNLIETVSGRICRAILEAFPLVKSVRLNIRKPNAPLGVIDSVEIVNELERK